MDVPVRRCEDCDFEYLDDEAEQLKHEAVCRHLGVLSPDEIRHIRKGFGMTQAVFAQVTGIGVASLIRWENGLTIQTHAYDRYLRLLAAHPNNIRNIEKLAILSSLPRVRDIVRKKIPCLKCGPTTCGRSKKALSCARPRNTMYITTFYSFKGGVGRTMALVNAAVKLAQAGRHVLVVDFDIEAPGLDTFDVLKPRKEVPGVIDFVTQYLESGQSPDVSDFIGECPPIGEQDGKLCIMPSGRKETYAANFNQIDWGSLYERRDGFLLFEDIREQWKQTIKPDYVLIDSRTGHTDTSGICTRQLPNAVVVPILSE